MEDFKIAISKDAIATMPYVSYDGGIMVVDSVEKARVALRELSRARIVGFDTETRPSFRKGRVNKVALMQLATDDFCFLFRLNIIGISDSLKDFLENPDIIKIGLSIHDDFEAIRRSRSIEPQGFIDLQNYVKQFNIADMSLQKIYAIVFGQCISKGQRLTNWDAPILTEHQQSYAAIDAKACLKLYRYLSSNRFDPAKSPYIVTTEDKTATAS